MATCIIGSGCGSSGDSSTSGDLVRAGYLANGDYGNNNGNGVGGGPRGPIGPGTGVPNPYGPGGETPTPPPSDDPLAFLVISGLQLDSNNVVLEDGVIYTYSIFEDGHIELASSLVTTDGRPIADFAVSPDEDFLLIGLVGDPDVVQSFNIDSSTGELSLNGPPLSVGPSAGDVIMNAAATFAYVANIANVFNPPGTGDTVEPFLVDGSGQLTPNGTFISTGSVYYGLRLAPSGDQIYTFDDPDIRLFNIQPNGQLTPGPVFLGADDARDMVFSNDGAFAYVWAFNDDETLSLAINPGTGALTEVHPPLTLEGPLLSNPVVDKLYLLAAGGLHTFDIADDGLLTEVGTPLTAQGFFMDITPDGHFLYVISSDLIQLITLDDAGNPVSSQSFTVDLPSPESSGIITAD